MHKNGEKKIRKTIQTAPGGTLGRSFYAFRVHNLFIFHSNFRNLFSHFFIFILHINSVRKNEASAGRYRELLLIIRKQNIQKFLGRKNFHFLNYLAY